MSRKAMQMTAKLSAQADALVSQRIHEWFAKEKAGLDWDESIRLQDAIDAMIAAMPEPLPESAAAWKRWIDFENDTSRHDPGLRIAMDLCAYAEWSAKKTLGLTEEKFADVPQLVVSITA